VRQLIDQHPPRVSGKGTIQVELLAHDAGIADGDGRDCFETFEQPLRVDAAMRLDIADDHVLARCTHVLRGFEHRVGLADAGGSAKENAQATALGARRFRLDLSQGRSGSGRTSAMQCGYLAGGGPGACTSSRARFSSRTLTRGSPSHPSNLPRTCSPINA
jgi:hypothetical protein